MIPNQGAFADIMSVAAKPHSESDEIIRGLERKLDVLRAQLAASQAGEDIGQAGVTTWSRLEVQSQRIIQLEQDLQRARDEIRNGQRANIALNRALDAASQFVKVVEIPVFEPATLPPTPSPEALLLESMRNSTSWRITAPMRGFVTILRRLRQIARI
jgi:hypothetical protein